MKGAHPKIPAAAHVVGQKIVAVRPMSVKERDQFGWGRGVVMELSNGTLLVPQSDDEGNQAGTVMVQTPDGETTYLLEMA